MRDATSDGELICYFNGLRLKDCRRLFVGKRAASLGSSRSMRPCRPIPAGSSLSWRSSKVSFGGPDRGHGAAGPHAGISPQAT
jgi:hypothetical protein